MTHIDRLLLTIQAAEKLNGLSSVIYRNRKLQSELKILMKIQLDVFCAHMVDSCRPGYNFNE